MLYTRLSRRPKVATLRKRSMTESGLSKSLFPSGFLSGNSTPMSSSLKTDGLPVRIQMLFSRTSAIQKTLRRWSISLFDRPKPSRRRCRPIACVSLPATPASVYEASGSSSVCLMNAWKQCLSGYHRISRMTNHSDQSLHRKQARLLKHELHDYASCVVEISPADFI